MEWRTTARYGLAGSFTIREYESDVADVKLVTKVITHICISHFRHQLCQNAVPCTLLHIGRGNEDLTKSIYKHKSLLVITKLRKLDDFFPYNATT